MTTHIILLIALQCLHFGLAQIATYDIHLGDLHKMQTGLGWPDRLNVFVGHEALLKLVSTIENFDSCEVTTPQGVKFDVQHPPSNRFEVWGESCGVRIQNVVEADNGRWRLTATRGNDSSTGWTEVYVEAAIDNYHGDPIILHDGQTHTKVELSTLTNSYCLVAQPFSDSSLVPGHCTVTLDRTTRAVQGNWHVWMGLPGRVSELQIDRSVSVESERLDVGFLHETTPNKLHLYCNIEHTEKNITFCRFQKTSEKAGFSVMDGLSDGTHSYYGDGFSKRQCGITIEFPTDSDFATWRCTVGVQEWVGDVVAQRTPLQALIRVLNTPTRNRPERSRTTVTDDNGNRTIFVQKDMSFTITCQADRSLAYCWFQHPNGSQYTPTERGSDEQPFWYSGESLQLGDCGITFSHATVDEAGTWTCHMGPQGEMGPEITDTADLRVTGPLAATVKTLHAVIGYNATLYCHTSNGNRPLKYCRFLTPQAVGFNVGPTVTDQNPILERFFFTPGRDLNYGDCSLNISPVLEEDMGEWTCAALVDEEEMESSDTIQVYTEAEPAFQAGVIGMSIGAAVLILSLVGFLGYRYRSRFNVPWRRTNNTDRTDAMSFEMRMQDTVSMGSDSSVTVPNEGSDNFDTVSA